MASSGTAKGKPRGSVGVQALGELRAAWRDGASTSQFHTPAFLQGQSQDSSPPLPWAWGASGVGFCPASTSEVPTGCCGGAASPQVLWEVMFLVPT